MKKNFLLVTLTVCLLSSLFTGCTSSNNAASNTSTSADKKTESVADNSEALSILEGFDEYLDNADVIMAAKVVSAKYVEAQNSYYEYTVEPIEGYKGDTTKTVRDYNDSANFKEDEDYIFVLQHMYNVFNDEYTVLGSTVIGMDDKEIQILGNTYEIDEIEKMIDESLARTKTGSGDSLSIPYTTSTDAEEIKEFARCVVSVKVGELEDTTDYCEIYTCEVVSLEKGEINSSEDSVHIAFFPETVATGDTVTVALTSDVDDSLVYTVAAKDAILER